MQGLKIPSSTTNGCGAIIARPILDEPTNITGT